MPVCRYRGLVLSLVGMINDVLSSIEIINEKARHNRIDAKYYVTAGVPISSNYLLFGIWSNKPDANLEDSDCPVRMLLFVSMQGAEIYI